MRVVRLLLVGVGLSVAAVLNLAACGSEGVTVPPGFDALGDCEVQQIAVVELSSGGEPGCDLEGSSLVFPDGNAGDIAAVGIATGFENSSLEGVEFRIVNWGVPGVGASVIEKGRLVDLWGSTPEALELQQEQMRIEGIATP